MSIDPSPIDVNEPQELAEACPAVADLPAKAPGVSEPAPPVVRGSRWVDYDTHELLQLISDLEDERRWARFREGIWLAILIHAALFAAVMLLPKYVFVQPAMVDSSKIVKEHQDFTYFDAPKIQPKIEIKPAPIKPPEIDKKTLEDLK